MSILCKLPLVLINDTLYHLAMVAIKQTSRPMGNVQVVQPVIATTNLSLRYGDNLALANVQFRIFRGERIAVIGPNGAGKSSLFKVLVGLASPHSGNVYVHGEGNRHSLISYVPQHEAVDWRFPVNVWDVVMMSRARHIGYVLRPRRRDRDAVETALKKVDMWDFRRRQIGQLSGGQRRRVFIARALAQEARVLIMDEPFAGVDSMTEQELFSVLDRLRSEDVAVIIATHNLDQAATHYDRVLLLNQQQIAFGKPDEVYTLENMQRTFGGYRHLVTPAR